MSPQDWILAIGLAVTALNAWLIYRGSDRASKRTLDATQQANSTTGFQALTQEQRAELVDCRARVREAEDSAERSKRAAERAEEIAENSQERENMLILAYAALWEWAEHPCPHPEPPPRLPVESWK